MKYIILIAFFLVAVGIFSRCNSFLEVNPPADQLSNEEVFGSKKDIDGAIAGIYYNLTDLGNYTFYNSVCNGLYADELQLGTNATDEFREFESAFLSQDNSRLLYFWKKMYATIYGINIAFKGIEGKNFLAADEKHHYAGELAALRAYCYLELVNKFGGVPIVDGIDYQLNANLPRADSIKIYQFIEKDLEEAITNLTSDGSSGTKFRIGLWAAKALLARFYWVRGDYDKALQRTGEILSSENYGPLPPLENVFLKNSSEIIWMLDYQNNGYLVTAEADNFIPSSGSVIPNYILHPSLLASFEQNDRRVIVWTGHNTVDGVYYYYPSKYKNTDASTATDFVSMIRLPEIYLISAEAKARLNDLNGAANDLDMVRIRAGLPSVRTTVQVLNQTTLLTAILHERQTEFFTEGGLRWSDLKRRGSANVILSQLKPATWNVKGILWPIPNVELERNPFLTPNPSN